MFKLRLSLLDCHTYDVYSRLSSLVFFTLFQISGMLGMPDISANDMVDKLEGTLPIIKSVNESFKDPVSTQY